MMSNLYHLHRFNNTLGASQDADGYDRLYLPRLSHITGDIDGMTSPWVQTVSRFLSIPYLAV
ncbi:TIGR03032 family protein [Pseudomonadales bacterium]|nr:TIGR03032 family protein [Pseudomonadales bacterium]